MPIGYIVHICSNALIQSLPWLVAWILLRGGYVLWRWRHGQALDMQKERWLWFVVMYLTILIQITVFRFGLQFVSFGTPRTTNWVPLSTLKLLAPWAIYYNVIGNVVWFIPLGLGLPFIASQFIKLRYVLVTGCLLSMSIEGLQYIFYTGITDVDDVIFNTIGAAVGWLLVWLWHKIQSHQPTKDISDR